MGITNLLQGDVAVVTGAASGNGREMARRFAQQGADVVVADINREPREGGDPTDEVIEDETSSYAKFVSCDVSNMNDLYDAVDAADEFGGVSLMVNNAGITESRPFSETTERDYETLMNINLKGVYFGSQAAAKSMKRHDRSGAIINISSTSGIRGRADGVAYCAAKGGVKVMTQALADALAPDIRVNSVLPDLTETEMANTDLEMVDTDLGNEYVDANVLLARTGQPSDIADTALYLASDLASFVTGHALVVDGGVTATK